MSEPNEHVNSGGSGKTNGTTALNYRFPVTLALLAPPLTSGSNISIAGSLTDSASLLRRSSQMTA